MACTFQSTFPLQGTTDVVSKSSDSGKFQSTFPLQGTTHSIATQRSVRFISIHVPIAGNDEKSINYHHTFFYFNPRSHCRERRQMKAKTESLRRDFNPRSHCRERQPIVFHYDAWKHFNPRSHCRERLFANHWKSYVIQFQSTFPLQGTTMIYSVTAIPYIISIHVPIAGNDSDQYLHWQVFDISIHVPIAGNDSKLIQFLIYNCKIFVLYYSYL